MMAASRPSTRPKLSPQLEERLKLHREEVARLREELGDPLFAFVRDWLDVDVLARDGEQPNEDGTEGSDDNIVARQG
jgi:hypothetical protein